MKINYQNILKKNMINVLKDVLKNIEENGLKEGHHLYITFLTNHPKTSLPSWLKEKFPNELEQYLADYMEDQGNVLNYKKFKFTRCST